MKAKKFKYIMRQTFQSIWRNKLMGIASIGSVTAVLIILGYILMIVLNVNNVAMVTKEEFDQIVVYIKDESTEDEIKKLGEELEKIDGVLTTVYKPKEEALEELKGEWGDEASLLEDLRRNPLPNSYIIQVKDVIYSDSVISKVKQLEGIESTRYYQEAVKSLISISNILKKIGVIVTLILILISIFIISNTVKITVVFRRKEIELMQYIGATNGYVRGPFLIEGIILGILGSLIAIGIIAFSYNYFTDYMTNYFALVSGFSNYIINFNMILKDIVIIFLTIGTGIGTLGSLISLKKFLNA
ncbi:ABC transporter permease [Sedimentibacter sp. zth1]|uniref:permease-like cell division protein FtsX n=1 Tax=Sedimentibacter sp. zth1 TaxID=2816908 RepID=UPI001A9266D6|nr:permease-like cell division protein FtsX [Sedimentibacter sp. zth1]QSX06133.1 ABC transporter permease [Sedimentibacter sp. zth1]